MQKKIMWAVLGTLLAVVIASVTLVFAVGRKTSADSEDDLASICVLNKAEYFDIDENGVFQGFTTEGENYVDVYKERSNWNTTKVLIVFPDNTTECYAPWKTENFFYFIPESVKNIAEESFYNCTVYCEVTSDPEGWNDRWNIDGNNDYPANVWYGCVLEDEMVYGLTDDESSYELLNCFASYSAVTIAEIINYKPVTTIDEYNYYYEAIYVFDHCKNILSITIPNSVTAIENYAFQRCENLTTIYCEADEKPTGWNEKWNLSESDIIWNEDEPECVDYYFNTVWGYVIHPTITFNSNGGNAVDHQVVNNGDQVTKPTDPTKDGYIFAGWYTDEKLTNEYDFASAVTSDLTLYAKWEEVVVEPEEPETPVVEEPTESETPVEDNKPENPVTEDDTNTKDEINVAVIAGGVAGGVVAVGVLGTIIGFAIKKRKLK